MTPIFWSFTDGTPQPTGVCQVSDDRTSIVCRGRRVHSDLLAAFLRSRGPRVTRFPCRVLGRDDQGELYCILGKPTLDYDATEVLRLFARKEALRAAHLWGAPPVVKRYLRTGDLKLREAVRTIAQDTAKTAASVIVREAAWATVSAAKAADRVVAEAAVRDATWATTEAAAEASAWATGKGGAPWGVAWYDVRARQYRRLARMLHAGARRGR